MPIIKDTKETVWLKNLHDIFIKTAKKLFDYDLSNTYIAGGCFLSIMNEKEPYDVDIFFYTEGDCEKFLQHISECSSKIKESLVITKNAVTLKGTIYQIIVRDTGEPDLVVKDFDFEHLKIWYYPCFLQIHAMNPAVLKYIENNQLKLAYNITSPYSTVKRFIKKVIRDKMKYDQNEFKRLCSILGNVKVEDLKEEYYN